MGGKDEEKGSERERVGLCETEKESNDSFWALKERRRMRDTERRESEKRGKHKLSDINGVSI